MRPRISAYVVLFFAVFIVFISACNKKKTTPPADNTSSCTIVDMTPYIWTNPPRFPIAEIPADNQFTIERIALGRQLYYDSRLSSNGESCNTCHQQNMGFSASGVSDFDKGLTKLPLINLAWYKNFMWSGRITGTLEDVMYAEVTQRFNTDLNRINAIQDYRDKFCKYYGVSTIKAEDLAKAMAQFMRILVSSNNKYDQALLGYTMLNPAEQNGYNIFFTEKGDCFHCHAQVVLTDNMMHNNGLDSIYDKEIDHGYYNVTHNEQDLGKFRTPNLRNVGLRTEFMHDGRFKSLMEVINFYDHGVHTGVKNIDPLMVKPAKIGGLKLTEEEKYQLVLFLQTLTDTVMTNNPDYKQ